MCHPVLDEDSEDRDTGYTGSLDRRNLREFRTSRLGETNGYDTPRHEGEPR